MATEREQVLEGALRTLIRRYVNLLENGRSRILDLGGQCDPLDKMEAADPWLREARNALAYGVKVTFENGKRSTSAATASGHELPNGTAAAAASLPVANGGDARVASAGRPSGVGASPHETFSHHTPMPKE